jgi:hypothetical protein
MNLIAMMRSVTEEGLKKYIPTPRGRHIQKYSRLQKSSSMLFFPVWKQTIDLANLVPPLNVTED